MRVLIIRVAWFMRTRFRLADLVLREPFGFDPFDNLQATPAGVTEIESNKMRILIAGAGIAGLSAALALTSAGHTVEVIDYDPPPPPGDMNEIFDKWDRKGVSQMRQSHAFHARIVNLIRENHPELHRRLLDAGVTEFTFEAQLWPTLAPRYVPVPIDAKLRSMVSRRTTLEALMRAYAEERCGAIFHSGYKVRGILCTPAPEGIATARAFKVETPSGVEETWQADLLIDAAGRNSPFLDWLKEFCVVPETDEAPVGIVYCTRYYRVNPGQIPLPRPREQAGFDISFIRGGMFPGDAGNFSITFILPEIETELRQVILYPDVFESFARKIPGLAAHIDPAYACPVSKVHAMGNLKNVWRHWIKDGKPLILNYFAIGDSTMCSNPLFGRGCSLAMTHAYILGDALRESDDPIARAKLFARRANEEIRPFYDAMVQRDQAGIKQAEIAQNPGHKLSFREKLQKSFADDAVGPAIRSNLYVARSFMISAQMIDHPSAWMKKPAVLAAILAKWATPKRFKRHLYAKSAPLNRSEFLAIAEEKLRARKLA